VFRPHTCTADEIDDISIFHMFGMFGGDALMFGGDALMFGGDAL
jgi:hypothetical protein